jgi:hypothetical protein
MDYEYKTLAELIAYRAAQVRHAQALARMDAAFNAMHGKFYGDRSAQDRAAIARIDARCTA